MAEHGSYIYSIIIKHMNKKILKTGNDGYGCKNITIKKTKYGIMIEKSDPHDWGRKSFMGLSYETIDELIKFLKTK